MPREREDYRENLSRLIARFGDCGSITPKEAADYCGCDQRTIRRAEFTKKIGKRYFVSMIGLARWLS